MDSKKTKLIKMYKNIKKSESNPNSDSNSDSEQEQEQGQNSEPEPDPNPDQDLSSEKKRELNKIFLDKIIKFIKTDDLIKKKEKENKEEIKVLKNDKKKLEAYILNYLEKLDENYVSINGTGKLIKNESNTRGTIKVETIQESIMETFKNKNLNLNPELVRSIVDDIIIRIDNKRGTSKRIYLKRTTERKKKT